MAIDWKTIISEFDGKPTLLQAIGKLRKAVEDETITIQQAQAEIAKLESQQKADEALITTAQSTADEAKINAYNASQKGDQALGKATTADTKAQAADTKAQNAQSAAQAADTKAQQALDLAKTNETNLSNKQDKIGNQTELTARSLTTIKDIVCENNLKGRYLFCSHTNMGSPSNSSFLIFEYGQYGEVKSTMRFQTFSNFGKDIRVTFPNEDGTVAYTKNFKTIFGNQSLVGSGNIDLYRHTLTISGTFSSSVGNFNANEAPFKAVFISSNNLNCDSIADLKTVLGNEYYLACMGAVFSTDLAHSYPVQYITSSTLNLIYNGELISISITGAIITDTVTAI